MLRRIVPSSLKRRLKLALRALADARSGDRKRFARPAPLVSFSYSISLTQPILNATDEQSRVNKIHNIKNATTSIEAILIEPGEIFSFWQITGAPSRKNNFRKGVNIINDKVVEDYGGGLCQLSGIIYHLSLIAGLTVLERSNHSVDLYHDQERYTPLGADCAVFYGYKDLRLTNEYNHPVRFRFEVSDDKLTCFIDSPVEIKKRAISFETQRKDGQDIIVTTKSGEITLAYSRYKKKTISLRQSSAVERPTHHKPIIKQSPQDILY